MKFIFNKYGDSWRFDLRLERIDPPCGKDSRIEVVETVGNAPPQCRYLE